MIKIAEEIKNIISDMKRPLIIAIDGRCGGGKTTLAAQLESMLSANVIHMDDFFLQPHQRSEARLNIPGENVDHERFLSEVLIPLKSGKSFSYRPYMCHTQSFGNKISVIPNDITVVEGSYSCHPELWEYYDLHIFMDVDYSEQIKRIEARNPDATEIFKEKWIPLEEKYFAAYNIKEKCELKFNTDR